MTRLFWNRLYSLGRLIRFRFNYAGFRLRYGKEVIPKDLQIASGVRISVTDNGRMLISAKCSIDRDATLIVKFGELIIGEGSYIGIGSVLCSRKSISIGRNVLIAEYVTIRDQDHEFEGFKTSSINGFTSEEISIGNNVWLGAKATVTKGVTIGDNSVIGANSVITGDIPANVLAAGSPARVIRQLKTLSCANKNAPSS